MSAFALAGCCDESTCGPCPDSVALTVVDSDTGGAVGDARLVVEGEEETAVTCVVRADGDAADGSTLCHAHVPPGDYRLTVEAPGYEPATREVALSGAGDACCACPESFEDTIRLAPQ